MNKLFRVALGLLLGLSAAAQTPTSGLAGPVATPATPGSVKPNISTMTVAADGTISPINNSSAPQYVAPQALSGCGVEYVSGLTYTVGACTYVINGVQYSSSLSNITLAAADPSNPRIDVIFVDATGVVQKLTGTPASTPQQPVVDPSTQLQLTFVLVPTSSTTPGNTTLVDIYLEGSEWTGATGGTNAARVNLTSTSLPYSGTHNTEFGTSGTVDTTTFASYTDPSAGTVNLSNYNALVFYMLNKAAWPATRSVTVQWFSGSTAMGTPVVLSNGAFGFNATTNTSTYQQISIPAATFGIAGIPVTTVRFTVTGTGTALTGFHLDEVTLQGGNGGVVLPTTLMNFKGPWSATATYNPNDLVTSGGVGYVALASSTNKAVSVTAFWTPLASGSAGGCTFNVFGTNNANICGALPGTATGHDLTASGFGAMANWTGGVVSTAFGQGALAAFAGTGGHMNAFGSGAMQNATSITGPDTALGSAAMFAATTIGDHNVAVGDMSMGAAASIGSNNTAVGDNTLANETSNNNTAFGSGVLALASGQPNNTGVGGGALALQTSGFDNSAFGAGAGEANTTGFEDTMLGELAGAAKQTISASVFVGYLADSTTDGLTDMLVLGANALGTASHQVTLGASTITSTILQGLVQQPAPMSSGTKFTTSGCSVSSSTGGASAGTFTLGANSCTVVVTLNGATGLTATNGWSCTARDRTAPTILIGGESSSTATTASIVIPAGAGSTDVISFSCTAF